MSKLTTFQELRHKCAELYCPKDWSINLWADFFGDCFKIYALKDDEREQQIEDIMKTYNADWSLVVSTVAFQRDNGMIID